MNQQESNVCSGIGKQGREYEDLKLFLSTNHGVTLGDALPIPKNTLQKNMADEEGNCMSVC